MTCAVCGDATLEPWAVVPCPACFGATDSTAFDDVDFRSGFGAVGGGAVKSLRQWSSSPARASANSGPRIPGIPVDLPRAVDVHPGLPDLPAGTTLHALQLYFEHVDLFAPMLHATRVKSKPLSTLFCAAALLSGPRMAGTDILGTNSPRESAKVDKPIAELALRELKAALDTGVCAGENAAAAASLAIWAMYRGFGAMAADFLFAARLLAFKAGIVAGPATFASPRQGTWEDLAHSAFGRGWKTRIMSTVDIMQLRLLWIDYWVAERIAWSLYMLWRGLASDRLSPKRASAETDPINLRNRYPSPMPRDWEASFRKDFDPRRVPRAQPVVEAIQWLTLEEQDAKRNTALKNLGGQIAKQRTFFDVLHHALRSHVDHFLSVCREKGCQSPFELFAATTLAPQNHDHGIFRDPAAAQELLILRETADLALRSTWDAMPRPIHEALSSRSAQQLINFLADASGSFWFAFNRIVLLCSIPIMRLELFTCFGSALVSDGRGAAELLDKLADEILHPTLNPLFEQANQYTALLKSWISLNPNLDYHISAGATVFRLFCLHLSVARHLRRRALNSNAPDPPLLPQSLQGAVICLDILGRFAKKGSWMVAQYKLARNLYQGISVSVLDVALAKARVDLPAEVEG